MGEGLKPSLIRDFFNSGHDVFLALSGDASTQLREMSTRLGVDVDVNGTSVIDHFSFDKKLGASDHATVLSSALAPLSGVFGAATKGPFLYRGVGLSISPESEVAFLGLTGSPTAYSGSPGKPVKGAVLAGKNLGLVALVQGRNNARLAVVGSTDMLSNAFLEASKSENARLAADVLHWSAHERGVLKASALRHRIVGGEEQPAVYRINDDVEVELDIEECSEGVCKPYK